MLLASCASYFFLCCLSGLVSSGDEDEAEGPAETSDGEVPRGRGPRLRGYHSRVVVPAVTRDAEPSLWPLPVLQRGYIHFTNQPGLGRQPGTRVHYCLCGYIYMYSRYTCHYTCHYACHLICGLISDIDSVSLSRCVWSYTRPVRLFPNAVCLQTPVTILYLWGILVYVFIFLT